MAERRGVDGSPRGGHMFDNSPALFVLGFSPIRNSSSENYPSLPRSVGTPDTRCLSLTKNNNKSKDESRM